MFESVGEGQREGEVRRDEDRQRWEERGERREERGGRGRVRIN